jgi:peroxiredoxin
MKTKDALRLGLVIGFLALPGNLRAQGEGELIVVQLDREGKSRLGSHVVPGAAIPVGDFRSASDSFRIGLYDWNGDGQYGHGDRVLIGEYKEEALNRVAGGGYATIGENMYLRSANLPYEVVEVDPAGRVVTLRVTEWDRLPPRITQGGRAPEITFDLLGGGRANLSDYIERSQHLVLLFWSPGCTGTLSSLAALKEMHDTDGLTVLGMYDGTDSEEAAQFIEEHAVHWPVGLADSSITRTFEVDASPHVVLIDALGVILEPFTHPILVARRFGLVER